MNTQIKLINIFLTGEVYEETEKNDSKKGVEPLVSFTLHVGKKKRKNIPSAG